MGTTLQQVYSSNPAEAVAILVLGFVLFVLLGLLPALGLLQLIYFVLTLPLRRNERIRLFLDLLELGVREGRTPENAIADLAETQDPALGRRFLLVADLLKSGMRLTQALDQVPSLLPAQVRAMLAAGERIGDVRKVLPACRLLLQDGISHVRGALNYLVLLSFITSPIMIAVPLVIKFKVLPSFRQVFEGFTESAKLPAFTRFVFADDWAFVGLQVVVLAGVWALTLLYILGPRVRDTLEGMFLRRTTWLDRLAYTMPWRRKRLQRDFSSMLAALLDAGVPEGEAVRLAGDATANQTMRRRAAKVCAGLEEGVKLPEALEVMEPTGELRWRVTNAVRRGNGFARALEGWHEALAAKAFQLEQTWAQILTTSIVILNGLIVCCIMVAMFLPLIQLITQVSVW